MSQMHVAHPGDSFRPGFAAPEIRRITSVTRDRDIVLQAADGMGNGQGRAVHGEESGYEEDGGKSDTPLSGSSCFSLGGHTTCSGFCYGQPQRIGQPSLLHFLIGIWKPMITEDSGPPRSDRKETDKRAFSPGLVRHLPEIHVVNPFAGTVGPEESGCAQPLGKSKTSVGRAQ